MTHSTGRRALMGLTLLGATGFARGQPAWPARPVQLVHGFGAGGNADVVARLIGQKLEEALGQQIVVEIRSGAGGMVATSHVAKAAPDGHTLVLLTGAHTASAAMRRTLPYDPVRDFAFVSTLTSFPFVIAVRDGHPARSLRELLELARSAPDKVSYTSVGVGSTQHLVGALLGGTSGAQLLHVPYRGGGPALNDVMGGQVPLFFANVASSLGHVRSGKLRALGVTAPLRTRALPAVPAIAESGVKGVEVFEWNPILAPAGIAPDARATLVAAIRRALGDPEVVGRIRALSGEVFDNSSEASIASFLKAQRAQWARLVEERGIAPA